MQRGEKKYRYPLVFEGLLYTILFIEKIYNSTWFCYLKKKKIWKGFSLLEEKVRSENNVQHLFCSELIQRQGYLGRENGTGLAPSQKLHWASQHLDAIALYCVCEDLCDIYLLFYASISQLCCKVIASSTDTISTLLSFHRNDLLSDNRGNLSF